MGSSITPQIEESVLQDIQEYRRRCEEDTETYLFFPLAEAFRQIGRHDEAISACKEAIGKYPEYWEMRVTLGRIYKEHEQLDEAKDQLELAVANLPNNLLAHKLLGEVYLSQNQDIEAIKCYRNILLYYPECSQIAATLAQLEEKELLYQQNMLKELESWKEGIYMVLDKNKDSV